MAALYLDQNVAIETAALLRQSGHQAYAVRELNRLDADDDDHLLFVAQKGWTLVTHDREDFLTLHRAWRRWTQVWGIVLPHAGILIIPRAPYWRPPRAAQELTTLLQQGHQLTNQLYEYDWQRSQGWIQSV